MTRISGKVQFVGQKVDEEMSLRRFHLTLPFDSSMDCYPSNTTAQYTTKLRHPLSLENDWEVALTEISVPDMFHNVKKDSCYLTLTEDFAQLQHSDRGRILRVDRRASEISQRYVKI